MSPGGSAVPRRVLSRQLKKLREESGVTPPVAHKHIGVSSNTLWRIESGQSVRQLLPPVLESLCNLYGAPPDVTRALLNLLEESKQPGWWYAYRDSLREDFDLYLGLEEVAERLTIHQTSIIPGLLQTAEYRRAILGSSFPQMADDEVDRRVELQMRRQDRLQDAERFSLNVLLGEAALRNRLGSPEVMLQQMHHLSVIGGMPNVSIRIVPFANSSPYGILTDSFILMEFPQRNANISLAEPPVVYVEGYTGALYLDKEDKVRQYVAVIPEIEKAALSQAHSRDLMVDIAKEYTP